MILPPACPLGILPPGDAALVSLPRAYGSRATAAARYRPLPPCPLTQRRGIDRRRPARSPGGAVSTAAALPAHPAARYRPLPPCPLHRFWLSRGTTAPQDPCRP